MVKKDTKNVTKIDSKEETFLKEVKEEVYKEQLHKLLNKYSKHILAGIAIIIVLVVGSVITRNNTIQKEEKYSEELYKATLEVRNQQYALAEKTLEDVLESNAPSTTKALTELKLAQVFNLQGKSDEALIRYKQVFTNRNYDVFVREFAGLSALHIMIIQNKDAKSIEALTKKLEQNKSGSLQYLVMEQKALWARVKGDIKLSNEVLAQIIADASAPHTIKLRAMEMKEVNNFIEGQNNK